MTLEIRNTQEARDDTESRVLALLDKQADAQGFPFVQDRFAFEAWKNDAFLGGLTARIIHDWMYVMLLAVAGTARGQGVGRRLLERAEMAARDQRATGIWLDTYSFQAPGFYERTGFERIAELPDSPAGQSRYFYSKRLQY